MKVSVCIPTVSRIAFLREALASIENQTSRDYEIVISENSAKPEYALAVESLASEFQHLPIRLYHQKRQLSMSGNANFLIEMADGEYWIYLPDDDRFMPNCLEALVGALESEPRAGFAFADHWIMDAQGQVDSDASDANSRHYGRDQLEPGFYGRSQLFELALIQVFELQSMLFRKAVIRELRFREDSGPIPDFDLQLRLWKMKHGDGAVYCPQRLNQYRIHGGMSGATQKPRDLYLAQIHSLETNLPPQSRSTRGYRRKLAKCFAGLSICEARAGEAAMARKNAARALTLDPLCVRTIGSALLSNLPTGLVRMIHRG